MLIFSNSEKNVKQTNFYHNLPVFVWNR